jgi:hypothetical protein
MRKNKNIIKRILLVSVILFPAIVWAAFKPVRVLAPELVSGITCKTESICLDDVSRYAEALKLYDEAIEFVTSNVGKLKEKPRVIFCSSHSCFRSFGFNKASAQAVGKSGIVIGPKGWQYYYLRHEIIHHLQAERMGVINQWRSPDWLIEGMAYLLSEDPRVTLSKSHQEYRERFSKWYKTVGNEGLWEALREI